MHLNFITIQIKVKYCNLFLNLIWVNTIVSSNIR